MKQLQSIVGISVASIYRDGDNGWTYDGSHGSDPVDPIEGFKNFKEMYQTADPECVSLSPWIYILSSYLGWKFNFTCTMTC